MLYIDSKSQVFEDAQIKHLNFFKCRVLKKLTGDPCAIPSCSICKSTNTFTPKSSPLIIAKIITFLTDENWEKIILGMPLALREVNNNFLITILEQADIDLFPTYFVATNEHRAQAPYEVVHALVKDIQSLFDYEWFNSLEPEKDYSAYHFAESLNRRSCTYCNRAYTTTKTSRTGESL